MNYTMRTIHVLSAFGLLISLSLAPAFALADVSTTVTASATATTTTVTTKTAAVTRAINRGDQELERRTTNLNDVLSKVADIKNLSASDKTAITTAITNQISGLAQLQAKIDSDTTAAEIKTDVESITSSYRIYALVLPQVRIIIAADRVVTIAGDMQLLSAKFESRISAAQSAGSNMTAAANAFADFNAKVSDAGTQAQAAVSEIATLVPDQGNATTMASNTAALKDARSKVVAAQQDLVAARADATIIVNAVKGKPTTSVSASATTTSETQTTPTAAGQ